MAAVAWRPCFDIISCAATEGCVGRGEVVAPLVVVVASIRLGDVEGTKGEMSVTLRNVEGGEVEGAEVVIVGGDAGGTNGGISATLKERSEEKLFALSSSSSRVTSSKSSIGTSSSKLDPLPASFGELTPHVSSSSSSSRMTSLALIDGVLKLLLPLIISLEGTRTSPSPKVPHSSSVACCSGNPASEFGGEDGVEESRRMLLESFVAAERKVEGRIGSARAGSRGGRDSRGVAVGGGRARGSNVGDLTSSDVEVTGARMGELGGDAKRGIMRWPGEK